MSDETPPSWTAFQGHSRIAQGPLAEVALAVRKQDPGAGLILIFDDATGRVLDLDLRGSDDEVRKRFAPPADGPARGRGRPRLGVTAREVTLLPRHWDWLAGQPGGASAALRRLVDEARKTDDGRTALRQARERCYRFLSGIAGDLPGFEEASRALFAGDGDRFRGLIADWPADIRDHALRLGEA